MKYLPPALLLLTVFAISPAPLVGQDSGASYPDKNSWYSRDKALHFGVSAVAAGGLHVLGTRAGLARWQSIGVSVGLVGLAGVLREVATTDRSDLLTRSKLSRRDLLWDGIGIGVGIVVSDSFRRGGEETPAHARALRPLPLRRRDGAAP